jgi:imidazolonepropionase-like amidohydrolase
MRARTWIIVSLGLLLAAAAVVWLLLPPAPLRAPRQDIVLQDVTVVNPGAPGLPHRTVTVHDGRIIAISDYRPARGAARPVEAGAYLLPGLIDMHVHHPPGRLAVDGKYFDLLHLAYGVTAVRDAGSIDGSTFATRKAIADGRLAGPRVFACGPIIDGDPSAWPGARIAHNAAEGERAADEIAASGADCIKVYSNLSADALKGVRAAATRRRLTLVGHTPFSVPLETAHIDDVQHLTGVPGLVASGKLPPLIDGLLQGWDDISDARIAQVVETSRAQGIAYTPTIVVIQQLLRMTDYPRLKDDPQARLLPRYYRELIWKPGGMAGWNVPPLDAARQARILRNFTATVRRLHEAGVTLHVGTDTFNPFVLPGVAMRQELANFVAAGYTPQEAWMAATRQNGAALSLAGLGTIQAGAPADLLLFRANPTRDLAAMDTLQTVIADGRLYPKATLDRAVDRYRRYYDSWLIDRLTMLVFPLFASQGGG